MRSPCKARKKQRPSSAMGMTTSEDCWRTRERKIPGTLSSSGRNRAPHKITDEPLRRKLQDAQDLAKDTLIQNACTRRVKNVIPWISVELSNSLTPNLARMKDLCDKLGSTGLYPYAISADSQHVSSHGLSSSTVADVGIEARQFPRHSGYPEDGATGIAAAALSWALEKNGTAMLGQRVIVHQGRAMGEPSRIEVNLEPKGDGCWVGGVCSCADNEY
jgi:PhzF family phenazine biosynthesis protein